MRVKLPESARDRKRSFGGTAASTLIHACLIGGTVVATGYGAQQGEPPSPPPPPLVYVVPARPPVDAPRPPVATPAPIPTNVVPPDPVAAPIVDLTIVPEHLPGALSTIGTVSPKEFQAMPRDSTPAGPMPASNEPYAEFMVEKAVRPLDGNPAPRYPGVLAGAGVEGVAWARFVVDTAGRVEPGSIQFIKSDHVLFERAVRDALRQARFSPAEVGRQRVRQLVEQAFSFALRR